MSAVTLIYGARSTQQLRRRLGLARRMAPESIIEEAAVAWAVATAALHGHRLTSGFDPDLGFWARIEGERGESWVAREPSESEAAIGLLEALDLDER